MLTNKPQNKRKIFSLKIRSFLAFILSFVLLISSVYIVYAAEENSVDEVNAVFDTAESTDSQSVESIESDDLQESIDSEIIDSEIIDDSGDNAEEDLEITDSSMIPGDNNSGDIISDESVDNIEETNSDEISKLESETDSSELSVIGPGEISDEIIEEPADIELEIPIPDQQESLEASIDNDELFKSYIENVFGINSPKEFYVTAQSSTPKLDKYTLRVYNYLVPLIKEVAAGTRTSTEFSIPSSVIYDKTAYTPEELGVSVNSNNDFRQSVIDKAEKLTKINLSTLLSALISNMPYELYWYDSVAKTDLTYASYIYSERINLLRISGNIIIRCPVSKSYSTGTYTLNTSKVSTVRKAAENARKIVEKHKGKSTVERLKAYRTEICNLVSYNSTAAKGGVAYGDPWQLVYVFDGNSNTNVVCEGYAKAFQYLCDLSEFSNVYCITVTGTMSGGTGQGSHMWNIVKMPNGKNYLVDVTNCDAGTVGADYRLFLVGYKSGSCNSGYTVAAKRDVVYKYDKETTDCHYPGDLNLNKASYPIFSISNANVSVSAATYSGKALTPAVTVKSSGNVILKKGVDYKVAYSNNVNAGSGTVKLTGIGRYYGSKSVSFTIQKASQTINASTIYVWPRTTVSLGATASGKGKLTYKSDNIKIAKVDSAGKVTGIAIGKTTITITAAATANYKAATKKVTVSVKNGNTLTVSAKKTTVTQSYTSLTKGNVTLASNCKVSNAKGKVTYANASTDTTAKKFKVTSSTGSVTIPKGTKKGTYKVIIKVSAAGNDTYFPKSKSVTYSIKVS